MRRYLIFGEPLLKRADLRTLRALDGLYAPEAAVLKAELLHARGRLRAYRQQLKIVASYPGMKHAVEFLESGSYEIEHAREGMPGLNP